MTGKRKRELILKRFQSHKDLAALEKLLPHIRKLQKLASQHGIELEEVYVMTPTQLEPYYLKWEIDHQTKGDLNNPKIHLSFVQQNVVLLYRNLDAPKEDDADIFEVLGDVETPPTGA